MIANRIHLTPTLRAKLNAKTHAAACAEEKLFLIRLRLSELALLLPLKQLAITQLRKRISICGPSSQLEQEIAQQQEQISDLAQLACDWIALAEAATQSQPNPITEPLKALLCRLGVDFVRSTASAQTHS